MGTEKNLNTGFIVEGELFGLDAAGVIKYQDGKLMMAGQLDLAESSPREFISQGINLPKQLGSSSLLPNKKGGKAYFCIAENSTLLMLQLNGMIVNVKLGEKWCIYAGIHTKSITCENFFEKQLKVVLTELGIVDFIFLIKSQGADAGNFSLLEHYSGKISPDITMLQDQSKYDILAGGVFNLNETAFGRGIKAFAGIDTMRFLAGGSISQKTFFAALSIDKIETKLVLIKNLSFAITAGAVFSLSASGEFTLKLDNPIGFTVAGTVTMSSFILSASSLKGTKLYLTKKLFFSDLILGIGIDTSGLMLTMCGRLTTDKISIFAGFSLSISQTPTINLITAAVSTHTGRLSLRDLIVDIAEINTSGLDVLDIIAIKDLDMNHAKMKNTVRKDSDENKVLSEFNQAVPSELKIGQGNLLLTPMGDNYIVTDKGKMRHYRIANDGKISLNCQIFICSKQMRLGEYNVKPGFFICGVLEIFKYDIRFLFQVVKGESLIALVQLPEIKIGGLLSLTKSGKKPPINPINGGLAGELIKPDNNGGVLYINVSKNSFNMYVSVCLKVLNFLKFDALVIFRNRLAYIDVELNLGGICLTVQAAADYSSFSAAKFVLKITFDVSKFREKVLAAANSLKNTAQQVKNATNRVINDLECAKRKVDSLNGEISYKRRQIQDCRNRISGARWWKKCFVAIAEGVKILAFEVAIAGLYVAMGVAKAALTVAQGIVGAAGSIAAATLKAVAFVLEAAVNVFMIKSMGFEIDATSRNLKIGADISFIILGKEKSFSKVLEVGNSSIESTANNFVDSNISTAKSQAESDIKNGNIKRSEDLGLLEFPEECEDLKACIEKYNKGRELMEQSNDLFMEVEESYREIYQNESENVRTDAADLTIIQQEIDEMNHNIFCNINDEFFENLKHIEENEKVIRSTEMNESFQKLHSLKKQAEDLKVNRNKGNASLLWRIEKQKPIKRSSKDEVPLESRANREMAKKAKEILDVKLGSKSQDNDFINLANEPVINEAINLLRLSGKRSKQRSTPPAGYAVRIPDEE